MTFKRQPKCTKIKNNDARIHKYFTDKNGEKIFN